MKWVNGHLTSYVVTIRGCNNNICCLVLCCLGFHHTLCLHALPGLPPNPAGAHGFVCLSLLVYSPNYRLKRSSDAEGKTPELDFIKQQSDLGICHAWQVDAVRQRNRKLKLSLQERRAQRKELQGEVQDADSLWSQAAADYQHLQASVHSMRCSLEVHPCALDHLDHMHCRYWYVYMMMYTHVLKSMHVYSVHAVFAWT